MMIILMLIIVFLVGYFVGWTIRDNEIDIEKESDF